MSGFQLDQSIFMTNSDKHRDPKQLGSITSRCSGNEPTLLPRRPGSKTELQKTTEIEPTKQSVKIKCRCVFTPGRMCYCFKMKTEIKINLQILNQKIANGSKTAPCSRIKCSSEGLELIKHNEPAGLNTFIPSDHRIRNSWLWDSIGS